MKRFFPALLSMVLLYACSKKSMDTPVKTVITLNNPVALAVDSLKLSAQISANANMEVLEAGFIWTSDTSLPTLVNTNRLSFQNPGTSFTTEIDNSYPDIHYNFRAYAKVNGDTIYSLPAQYTSPSRGSWHKLADFPGAARSFPIYFSLNGKGYICGGWNGSAALKDCWSFDPATAQWTQLPDFPGAARSAAFFFVIGNKAYCGGGSMQNPEFASGFLFSDVYSFDGTNWTQLNDFPNDEGGAGIFATYHFSSGGFGYVGGGEVSYQQPGYAIHQYDPSTDTWTPYGANPYDSLHQTGYEVGWPEWFVVADTLFVGGGIDDYFRMYSTDNFFRYDIHAKTWKYSGPIPGGKGAYGVGFENSGAGYFAHDFTYPETWKYAYTNSGSWFKPASRNPDRFYATGSFAFTIGANTYMGLGRTLTPNSPPNAVYAFTGLP
jgi:Kelch motif